MSSCVAVEVESIGAYLIGTAVALLATTLGLATVLSSSPIEELGLRPKGSGLWSWVGGSVLEGRGIYGYDAIQGALSPSLRLQCHVAALLGLWGFVVFAWATLAPMDRVYTSDECPLLGFQPMLSTTFLAVVLCYGLVMTVLHHALPGVSAPGGPRTSRLLRKPQWKNKVTVSPGVDRCECLVADASHENTTEKFASKSSQSKLTGEPAGRQIWTVASQAPPPKITPTRSPTMSLTKKPENDSYLSRMLGAVGVSPTRSVSSDSDQSEAEDSELLDREDEIKTLAQGGRKYFGFNPSENPNSCDMLFRSQQIRKYIGGGGSPPTDHIPETVAEATEKAAHFYSMLQCEDGHFAADYGGPHFLMPGMVTAWYIMGKPTHFLDSNQVELLKHYILVHQQTDGGWGTHIESPSTMFGSTLMYVALRLLGHPVDDMACVKGRQFLLDQGGALYTSSWSKFYLCLLGCMDWKGHNSVPPEMWLLPNWFPFHPGRMWCHARMVYLPMGYLYGNRYVYPNAESDPLIQELRNELYREAYEEISWVKTRHWVADMDNYSPIPWVMKTLQNVLACYENWTIFQPLKRWVRQRGIDFSMEYIRAEDLQTNYIDIGPVNKVLNMISHFHANGGNLEDECLLNHFMRVQDYLWVAEDGMKMQGYNGSQCWDTSFCAQALYEAQLLDKFPEMSCKIWQYLERTQILSTEVSQSSPAYEYETNAYRNKFYRHISEGGWPFSSSAHGWPISDCTAEGLKASICLLKSEAVTGGLKAGLLKEISDERFFKAANILLTYQNEDGGWATYENNRGWGWFEQLNPSEAFGDIMIDYSYVECSMAALTALADFREVYPEHRVEDIQHSIDKGRDFLKSIQRIDGSWYGSWACCFCYGVWFGVEGLVKCGESEGSPSITKACEFLLKHQRPNGGWGEDFTSCYDKDYAKDGMKVYGNEGSGVINTSWALLALSVAKCKDVDAIRRGVQYLMSEQLPSGDWPQEGIPGVFNRSVGITYTAYRNVFPIWAMGRCREEYGDALDQ